MRTRPGSTASTCASTRRATGASFWRFEMSSRSFSSWLLPSLPLICSGGREAGSSRGWPAAGAFRSSCSGGREAGSRRGWAETGACRSSAADGEGDVEGRQAALQEHGEAVAVLHVAREALEVGEAPDVLAVDLLDHVAPLDARLRGGAR